MTSYYGTKDVARLLGIRPDALSRAIWIGRIDAPAKSPSGNYLWTTKDIERAAWVLRCHDRYTQWQQGFSGGLGEQP